MGSSLPEVYVEYKTSLPRAGLWVSFALRVTFFRSFRETPWCEPRVETSTRLCRLRLCASSEAERIMIDYVETEGG